MSSTFSLLVFAAVFMSLLIIILYYRAFSTFFEDYSPSESILANLVYLVGFSAMVIAFSIMLIKIFPPDSLKGTTSVELYLFVSASFLIVVRLSKFVNEHFSKVMHDNLLAIVVLFTILMFFPPVPDLITNNFRNPSFFTTNFIIYMFVGLISQIAEIIIEKFHPRTPKPKLIKEKLFRENKTPLLKWVKAKKVFIFTLCLFISGIFTVIFILPTQSYIVPRDLPTGALTFYSESYGNTPILQITCLTAKHYPTLIVEGDVLTCESNLIGTSIENNCTIVVYPIVLNETHGIEYFGEFNLSKNLQFNFLIPHTNRFSFGVKGCYKLNDKQEDIYFSSIIKEYDGRWIVIRTKSEGDDYISKMNIFIVTSIISLFGIFPVIKYAREIYKNK
jgi:hypothetical protein